MKAHSLVTIKNYILRTIVTVVRTGNNLAQLPVSTVYYLPTKALH